jgi:hypothetical protein
MGMTTKPTRDSRETTGSADRARSGNPARSVQRAGSAVLGAAANKARSGVHGVANRLDRVATSSTASGRSAAGGLATTAGTATDTAKGAVKMTAGTATNTAKSAVTTVTDTVAKPLLSGVGAAFALALVVRKIMLFLRFLRQLALQLLEALRQLALRLREEAARRRGGEQEAIEDEAFEDEAVEDDEAVDEEAAEDRIDRREPATRPAPRPQSEGQRPQRPARPRRDVNAPQPDAPAPAVRRAPVARRPTRLGRRGPGASGRGE